MGWDLCYLSWFAIFLIPLLFLVFSRKKSGYHRLPPGPPGWPIFGNLFDLGDVPHQTIAAMRQRYGPVVWFKIGSIRTMAILSAKVAAEFFKNHDVSFADRKITDTMVVHNYNSSSLALAPYGTYWRMLRRICTMEMFTNKRINETVHLRRKCIDYMLQWIDKEANSLEKGKGVEVSRFVYLASFNMIGNLMLSHDLVDPESKTASDFFTALTKVIEWSGRPNISDIYPCLKWLDLQNLRQKSEHDMGKAVEVASAFVNERMKEQKEGREKKNDFVEVLFEFEGNGKDEPAKLSEHQINIFILEMFIGSSETTSSSSEWALTELLHNPEVMTKVKAELSEVVGNRKLEESDIDKLHYMQAVIKETLRLHPPIPFLLPRRAVQDTCFMGYDIPEDTQVFVNVWAIGRDPEFWEDPLAFRPERFLCSKIDFKGQCYEFIPFGAGRRMCVGLPLANRILHLALGSLLQEFDWELPENITPNSMDMTEKIGITVRKVQPLKAVPIKRRTSYSHKLQ